jgi:hypothetical protein
MEAENGQQAKTLDLIEFIQSSPALAEFIRQPVGHPLDDHRRQQLVQARIKLLLPYVSNSDIHEAIRADFSEALHMTEELASLLAKLLLISTSLEADQYSDQKAILLAGATVERDYEKMGMVQEWEELGLEVLAMLHKAAMSDEDWNAGEIVRRKYLDGSDARTVSRLFIALSIMMSYRNILDMQSTRLGVMKLAKVYDSLFYGGVLNGIGRRHQTSVIIDRLKEGVVSIAVGEIPLPGVSLVKELADLLYDLFNLENIFARDAKDLANISRYLKTYLQALRIVGTLAITLSNVNVSLGGSFAKILNINLSDLADESSA